MRYILTATSRNRNGKRHIVTRSTDLEYLRRIGRDNVNEKNITAIYNSKWELVEAIRG